MVFGSFQGFQGVSEGFSAFQYVHTYRQSQDYIPFCCPLFQHICTDKVRTRLKIVVKICGVHPI